MISLHRLLYIVAFILFLLAAIGVPSRVNLVALGLALLTATLIF